MKLQMFSLYDTKAEMYSKPFHAVNPAVAERIATSMASDPNSDVSRHPTDYKLYFMGTFDDETGITESYVEHIADVWTLGNNATYPTEIVNNG